MRIYITSSYLNFNTSYVTVQLYVPLQKQSFFLRISIHPMLRFNVYFKALNILTLAFQYILCYGSTEIALFTSLISSIISIHPMLRFNYVSVTNNSFLAPNFNTSYVTVQQNTPSLT